jgi:glutamyl-tRNA synthetase
LLRGDITVENRNVDDTILVKSDGLALYHLAAMVDDHEMKITHVIRGSEWLPSFTLHKMIIDAFGWEEPAWVHLSIFLKPSGKGKMSKRETADLAKDGNSFFVKDLEELGYLPEAVVNWITLMGWSYDDHTEFFTMADLVDKFSLERLNPAPAAINYTKFDYFNGLHIRALSIADLAARVKPFLVKAGLNVDNERLLKVAPIIQERIGTLDEVVEMAGFFFRSTVEPTPEDLVAKGLSATQSLAVARKCLEILSEADELTHEKIELPLRDFVEQSGLSAGQIFGILRVAVTGQKVSPPLFESMEIIGLTEVRNRVKKAIELLDKLAEA